MELRNAVSNIKKIFDCVTETVGTDKKMYAKTKVYLQNITDVCNQILDVVNGVGADVVKVEGQESESRQADNRDDLEKQINFLTKEMDRLKKFVNFEGPGKPKVTEPKVKEQIQQKTSESNIEKEVITEKAVAEKAVIKKADTKVYTIEESRAIVSRYADVLKRLARTAFDVDYVNVC